MIVSGSSRLRSSLRVLLKSMIPETEIEESGDIDVGLQFLSDKPQGLILLDAELPEWQLNPVCGKMGKRCVLLTSTADQQAQAKYAGINILALNSFTAESLFSALEVCTKD